MHILPLAQVRPEHLPFVGRKALSLAALVKAKAAVPQAYVITSHALADFLASNQLISSIEAELDKVNIQDLHSVDYASRVIHDLIMGSPWPKTLLTELLQQFVHLNAPRVAVRSSVHCEQGYTTAWAGELSTSLNLAETTLPDQIKACWASLYSSRSLYHLYQQHIPLAAIHMAVIVQAMVDARVSGLVYTVHPVHHDPNQMVIEAGLGLGEAIVGGKIVPDTFVVRKDPFKVLEKTVSAQSIATVGGDQLGTLTQEVGKKGSRPKLKSTEIAAIAKECQRLERVLGAPQTFEWALNDELFFLQTRSML